MIAALNAEDPDPTSLFAGVRFGGRRLCYSVPQEFRVEHEFGCQLVQTEIIHVRLAARARIKLDVFFIGRNPHGANTSACLGRRLQLLLGKVFPAV
jgi:hypothetical protein